MKLTKKELVNFGFIKQSSGNYELSKLIGHSKRPPFYLKMNPIDATGGVWWQILKDNTIVCIVSDMEEVEKAIFVLTDFRYKSLN